jgi:hypothetical protein
MRSRREAGDARAAAVVVRAGVRPVRRASGRRTGAARLDEWAPILGDSVDVAGGTFYQARTPAGDAGPA